MSALLWLGIAGAVWVVVSVAAALIIGPMLKRNQHRYHAPTNTP